MKRILVFICIIAINSFNGLYSQPLQLPETSYSLLSNTQNELDPIEINVNFVPDSENSKLEIGIVCNKTLGKQTLYTNISLYETYKYIGTPNWFRNYIKTQWNPASALMSFPTIEGLSIDCKKGAVYHFEYKFDWQWEGTYNSIYAFAYLQNTESKEIINATRSNNILYSEFNLLQPKPYLKITPNNDNVIDYVITNPTKENITYEVKLFCSDVTWQTILDKTIIQVPAGFSDTFSLNIKTTAQEQFATLTLSVTPKYLKNANSVPETRVITSEVITDGVDYLAITNENIPRQYYTGIVVPWHLLLRSACFAQPESGNKWVFMNYDYWQTNFPDIDYDILYLFGKSDINTGWATTGTLEKAALECIEKGRNLIVSSNVGLSINSRKLENYQATPAAKEFYNKLGIEYKGFIDLRKSCDTLSFRIVNNHELNLDINDSNTTVNSGRQLSKRVDYIGINGKNDKTFPFLWFNRNKEPLNSYAAVASIIGTSKIIYLSPGLETIGDVGDTLLIRNFMKWFNSPTSVTQAKNTSEFNIYPNPADKYIELNLYPDEIMIYNPLGENVSGLISKKGKRIIIENLTAGLYFCKIRIGDQLICKSFVIRR